MVNDSRQPALGVLRGRAGTRSGSNLLRKPAPAAGFAVDWHDAGRAKASTAGFWTGARAGSLTWSQRASRQGARHGQAAVGDRRIRFFGARTPSLPCPTIGSAKWPTAVKGSVGRMMMQFPPRIGVGERGSVQVSLPVGGFRRSGPCGSKTGYSCSKKMCTRKNSKARGDRCGHGWSNKQISICVRT